MTLFIIIRTLAFTQPVQPSWPHDVSALLMWKDSPCMSTRPHAWHFAVHEHVASAQPLHIQINTLHQQAAACYPSRPCFLSGTGSDNRCCYQPRLDGTDQHRRRWQLLCSEHAKTCFDRAIVVECQTL